MASRLFTRAILAALAAALFFSLIGPRCAHAGQRGGDQWGGGAHVAPASEPAVLTVAGGFVGRGKVTTLPGPWCGDFVSMVLRLAGLRPLPNRLAYSALSYGPRVAHPKPGDIVVMRNHVGFVVADRGNEIEIVSGNWSHRVARAFIPRRSVIAFIQV